MAALVAAVTDGTIDAIATDHAPHADYEQEVPFEEAPRGVIGLETAVAATLTALKPDPLTLFTRMSLAPASLARISDHGHPLDEGSPAHVVVIDPTATTQSTRFRSRSQNSPFRDRLLDGAVVATIYRGVITHHTHNETAAPLQ